MLIKMIYTARGSEDGHKVERFHEGETYDMADGLAAHFLRRDMAVEVPEDVA